MTSPLLPPLHPPTAPQQLWPSTWLGGRGTSWEADFPGAQSFSRRFCGGAEARGSHNSLDLDFLSHQPPLGPSSPTIPKKKPPTPINPLSLAGKRVSLLPPRHNLLLRAILLTHSPPPLSFHQRLRRWKIFNRRQRVHMEVANEIIRSASVAEINQVVRSTMFLAALHVSRPIPQEAQGC